MQLNTLYQFFFRSETENFRIDYFLTTDTLSDQVISEANVWLVISLESEDKQKFIVSKPSSILFQPKEIIEVIIQRETIHYMQHSETVLAPNC